MGRSCRECRNLYDKCYEGQCTNHSQWEPIDPAPSEPVISPNIHLVVHCCVLFTARLTHYALVTNPNVNIRVQQGDMK